MIVNLTPTRETFVFSCGTSAGHAPAASTTYFFGGMPGFNPATTSSVFSMIMPRAGNARIGRAQLTVGGTLASAGSITLSLRNNTGPTTEQITAALAATSAVNTAVPNTAMTLAFAAGDLLQIQFATPAWVTTPTATFWTVTIETEMT